jgi:hypothetical protein
MTVDGGGQLDSRQPVAGDKSSEVTLRSMAASALWWRTTSSLVMPVLLSAGDDAFALVIGQRSVVDVRPDGSTKRTSLRSLLPGGVTQIEVVRTGIKEPLPEGYELAEVLSGDVGSVGFNRGKPGTRWRFLSGNQYYLREAGRAIAPTVIVDTTPLILNEGYLANNLAGFELSRYSREEAVLVVPHTYWTDQFFRTYAQWVKEGRPPDPTLEWSPVVKDWDPDARPDPVRYATPVPIAADFGITGFLAKAEWQDPSGLEAARSLLEARYDLKIGIWDLASNATLRQTLLDVTPVTPAPPVAAAVPGAAAKRAEAKVDAKVKEREEQKRSLTARLRELHALSGTGWIPGDGQERWLLRLLMSEQYIRDLDQERYPLLQLELLVGKRTTCVTAFTILYWAVDLPDYAESRRSSLEGIAEPEECRLGGFPVELVRFRGGWGDDNVDWPERGERLADLAHQWRVTFADFINETRRKVPTSWKPV